MKRRDLLAGIAHRRFVPAGVADAGGKRAFVSDDAGGIAALDIVKGKELWRSRDAAMPLIALNGALMAAGELPPAIVLLDLSTGERLPWIDGIALPIPAGEQWAPLDVWCDAGAVRVSWQTFTGDRGVSAIDVETGAVSQQPLAMTDAAERAPEVVVERSRGKERLRLKTWSGEKQKSTELFASLPAPGYLQQHASPDADHLFFLVCNDAEVDGALPGTICDWVVVRAADGKRIAAIRNREGLQPPVAVIGDRFLYIEIGGTLEKRGPTLRMLRALTLASGELVWSFPIAPLPELRS
jgi:hypothetical protein